MSSAPTLPISAENSYLRLRLTQIALATSIGERVPPDIGNYVLAVFTLEDLADHPLDVGPQHLNLVTEDGQTLEPLEIGLDYPVARFYSQTIQPEHGTAALAIFALSGNTKIGHMQYNLPPRQTLVLDITQ